jgi:hypothetical protein
MIETVVSSKGLLQVSVPRSIAESELIVDTTGFITAAVLNTGDRHAIAYWIFHPSIRPEDAKFNYFHAFQDSDINLAWDGQKGRQMSAVQVIVCKEAHFDRFRTFWGRSHMVLCLPNSIDVEERRLGASSEVLSRTSYSVTVDKGIGYSRRVIHAVASQLKLPAIFQIDELVDGYAMVDGARVGGKRPLILCSMSRALMTMQRVIHEDWRDFTTTGSAAGPDSITDLKKFQAYTGGCGQYGVVGTIRLRFKVGKDGSVPPTNIKDPFTAKHVASATLLHVAAIDKVGISYPPDWNALEVRS